ncbi:unnamed protein product [Lactuca virosa]|uniref:Uncharacterized protein n=1 Tax=Lactuca virosa TaxID=75947 RepID=A0AAU9NCT4_9ASTR|nr:unnamed protein product [Lactuca virosa]
MEVSFELRGLFHSSNSIFPLPPPSFPAISGNKMCLFDPHQTKQVHQFFFRGGYDIAHAVFCELNATLMTLGTHIGGDFFLFTREHDWRRIWNIQLKIGHHWCSIPYLLSLQCSPSIRSGAY